jgi:hypothetical protein
MHPQLELSGASTWPTRSRADTRGLVMALPPGPFARPHDWRPPPVRLVESRSRRPHDSPSWRPAGTAAEVAHMHARLRPRPSWRRGQGSANGSKGPGVSLVRAACRIV